MKINDARNIVRRRLERSIADYMHARRKGWCRDTIREYAGHLVGIASIADELGVISDEKWHVISKFVYQSAYSLRYQIRKRAEAEKASAA